MNRLIISAPFGNYLRWPGVTSTVGTYTLRRRAGFFRRWWRVFSTVRYYPRAGAWINKLGLPSPGIDTLRDRASYLSDKILSVWAESPVEWCEVVNIALGLGPAAVEFNLSCPNAPRKTVEEVKIAVEMAVKHGSRVVAKLPPLRPLDTASPLVDLGVTHFHCCNTIPTPRGGISGKPLKPLSLWALEVLRNCYGNKLVLIGGGGITSLGDVEDYLRAGADHVAVGSLLFNPFSWNRIPLFRRFLDSYFSLAGKSTLPTYSGDSHDSTN